MLRSVSLNGLIFLIDLFDFPDLIDFLSVVILRVSLLDRWLLRED